MLLLALVIVVTCLVMVGIQSMTITTLVAFYMNMSI